MPTDKHRINVTVEDWMWDAVEDYRYHQRLISKANAVVRLMEQALSENGVYAPSTRGQAADIDDYTTLAAHGDGIPPEEMVAEVKDILSEVKKKYRR